MAVLEREGLKSSEAVEEKFDPYKHEVTTRTSDDDLSADTVLGELRRGCMLGSKVI